VSRDVVAAARVDDDEEAKTLFGCLLFPIPSTTPQFALHVWQVA